MKRKWACVLCGAPAVLEYATESGDDGIMGRRIVSTGCKCSAGFYAFPDPPMEGLRGWAGITEKEGVLTWEEWRRGIEESLSFRLPDNQGEAQVVEPLALPSPQGPDGGGPGSQ